MRKKKKQKLFYDHTAFFYSNQNWGCGQLGPLAVVAVVVFAGHTCFVLLTSSTQNKRILKHLNCHFRCSNFNLDAWARKRWNANTSSNYFLHFCVIRLSSDCKLLSLWSGFKSKMCTVGAQYDSLKEKKQKAAPHFELKNVFTLSQRTLFQALCTHSKTFYFVSPRTSNRVWNLFKITVE